MMNIRHSESSTFADDLLCGVFRGRVSAGILIGGLCVKGQTRRLEEERPPL